MKLVINYDFFNAVLNVNENFTPFKLIRNNKKLYTMYYLPIFMIGNYLSTKNIQIILQELILEYGFVIGSELFVNLITKVDIYKNKSKNDLKNLVSDLNSLYLNTDYELLLQSELYEKKYKVNFDKDSLLDIIESKYILVPTYDSNFNIKNTSILQEHSLGTNEYVLSIGSPVKKKKLVYSGI